MSAVRFPSRILPYVLLAPTLAICAVFIYYPAVMTFRMSAYRSLFFGARQIYVGADNFLRLLGSPEYRHSLWVTVALAAALVVLGLSLALALALLLNRPLRGARIWRVAIIWPYALSPAVAGTVWLFLFNPRAGIVNYVLELTLRVSPDWFSTPWLAISMVVAAGIWNNLGYNVVFLLAGLQNVPAELLEAAEVDGAGGLRKLLRITLPLLSPTLFFLIVMNITYAFFDTFGMIDVMTGGGPAGATNVLLYQLYKDGFQNFNSGLAAAQSLVLFLFVVFLTLLQFKTTGRAVYYAA